MERQLADVSRGKLAGRDVTGATIDRGVSEPLPKAGFCLAPQRRTTAKVKYTSCSFKRHSLC